MSKMLHTKAIVDKQNVSEAGVVTVAGSSAVVDRMGDIIDQAGWNLKNYLANPVILWGHNVTEERPPIGKALKVWIDQKGTDAAKLMFKVQFDLADSFAADIFRKIKDGFINTVSVGFMPTEWEELDPNNWFGGLKYTAQELLELSFVPVPANPEALVQLNSFASKDKRFTPVEEKDIFGKVDDGRETKMLRESKEVTDEMAKEVRDEFVKELKGFDEFQEGHFRALPMKKDEKGYVAIVGKLKDSDTWAEQSLHFKKSAWTEEEFNKAEDINVDGSQQMDETGNITSGTGGGTEETNPNESENEPAYDNETPLGEITASQCTEVMKEVMAACTPDNMKGKTFEEVKALVGGTMPDPGMCMKEMNVGHMKALMADTMGDWMNNANTLSNQEEGKELDVPEVRQMIEAIVKSGRVLSSKNEGRLKQAMDLLGQVLNELDKEEIEGEASENTPKANEEEVNKGVILYSDHGKAPESEGWDGPGEIAKANVSDLKIMCAWFDSSAPEDKGSYKLPHHKADGGHVAVWRGVAAAMAALLGARGGVDIPEGDRKGVYNHLAKHYKEFEKEAPEFKMVEGQVLAGFEEEIQALTLDREDKHMVRLIKKVLENQKKEEKEEKEDKKVETTNEDIIEALTTLNSALSKVDLLKGGKSES